MPMIIHAELADEQLYRGKKRKNVKRRETKRPGSVKIRALVTEPVIRR